VVEDKNRPSTFIYVNNINYLPVRWRVWRVVEGVKGWKLLFGNTDFPKAALLIFSVWTLEKQAGKRKLRKSFE